MKQSLKAIIYSFGLVSIAIFLWAFTDIDSFEMTEEPPGKIEVTGNAGEDKVFTFSKWKIEKLNWTKGDFENIEIEVLIDCKSLTHEWKDLEKNIKKKKDYFYVSKFPTATASFNGSKKMAGNSYETNMLLSLKGISKEVPVTFQVSGEGTEEDPYRVIGKGKLNRKNFKFNGNGPANEVPLNFDIILK